MSVFLTPEREPFFAGTYFPPTNRYGKPSFQTVLTKLAEAWREERDVVVTERRERFEQLPRLRVGVGERDRLDARGHRDSLR